MKLRIKFKEKKKKEDGKVNYYPAGNGFSPWQFGRNLRQLIEEAKRCEKKTEILFYVSAATVRPGDSLGPLIGYKLERLAGFERLVVGTLERPVHAVNLADTMREIRCLYPEHLVVAIDASIGRHGAGRLDLRGARRTLSGAWREQAAGTGRRHFYYRRCGREFLPGRFAACRASGWHL